MMFEFSSGKRRTRRNNHIVPSPASIESLETRSLLSAGPVVTIPGAVTGAGGQLEITNPRNPISWTAIPNATSYDVWVSDVESRVRTLLAEGLPSQFQEFTPTADYQLGESRIWVRANFADRTSTNWSTPVEVLLKTTPSLTIASGKVDGNQTPITWTSVNGARAFEIFVSNQTDLSSTVYRVPNQVVARDAAGNAIPDGKGSVLREEVREFYLSGAVTLPATAPRTITDVTNDPEMIISVANHGLKTGEQVRISGVTGNTVANGTWFVTRVDANNSSAWHSRQRELHGRGPAGATDSVAQRNRHGPVQGVCAQRGRCRAWPSLAVVSRCGHRAGSGGSDPTSCWSDVWNPDHPRVVRG